MAVKWINVHWTYASAKSINRNSKRMHNTEDEEVKSGYLVYLDDHFGKSHQNTESHVNFVKIIDGSSH